MRFLRFFPILLIITSTSFGGCITESQKTFIYEITHLGPGGGTGFVISDSLLGFVLVTCKHIVQDSAGNFVDSVFIRQNKVLSTGQTVSDTTQFVLRLKVNGRRYLAEHSNSDIDLVMIPILSFNITKPPDGFLIGLPSYKILSKEEMSKLDINEGTDVELIGFSLSSSLIKDSTHYHFSRFGKIGLYTTNEFTLQIDSKRRTANYILLDMSIRPGDSGSPIFAHIDTNRTYLIGFVSATNIGREIGIGYPVYYLYDLIKIVSDKFRAALEEKKK
ncbi:MAG: trypsin-like peptidase domain-containing protein [candidate division Zixibacteria bacterium]|nr:trypsin-like peptidase domain-containing protein [candidate division Zixibacteria bacterium]